MTRIIIIEDEILARKKLKRFLEELTESTTILAELDTVQSAIDFLKSNKADLIFSDIELLDGNAFEIYQEVSILCPIIFTTAYDQFWMNAFDGNGIAYLLKPFSKERFEKAWQKYLLLSHVPIAENKEISNLRNLIEQHLPVKAYKKRFIISNHRGIYFVNTEDIAYFEANEGIILAYDTNGDQHILKESTLKEIEEQLSAIDFFRINRSTLINKQQIEKIERYHKNTLSIRLRGIENYHKTSQSITSSFRDWLEK